MHDTAVLVEARGSLCNSGTLLGSLLRGVIASGGHTLAMKLHICFMKTSESVERVGSRNKGSKRVRIRKL